MKQVRPIDANKLFDFLTDQLEKEKGMYTRGRNAGLNIARSALHDENITPTITTPPNAPLTLDELREMDEGTVWVESQEQSKSGWALAGKRNCIHFRAGFSFNDYGKTWLAYRRKPEEVRRE